MLRTKKEAQEAIAECVTEVLTTFSKSKRDSVSGNIHLPFPALGFLEASLSFQKIALEFGFHTKNTRFFVIFKVKGIGLILGKLLYFMRK